MSAAPGAHGNGERLATVVELLQELRSRGANVIYSSELVDPQMAAPDASIASDVWARTRQALAAYGLELRFLGNNRYSVVRLQKASAPAPPALPDATVTLPDPPLEVSVYGSRYQLSRTELGEPALLDIKQIEASPGSRDDALRAVRVVPGIVTNSSTRPYIRGSFVDDVLVQFDGVPLADPFHLKNFQSLISAFDPEAVERIDVYSGGFPVRYGTRSGGVIDIEPRSVTSGYENTLGVSLLAYEVASVGEAQTLPVDWLVTARHSVSDVVLKPVNGHEGEPQFSDTLGRLRWRVTDQSALTLGWLLLDDQIALTSRSLDEEARANYRDEYAWLAYDIAPGPWRARTVVSATWADRSRAGTLDASGFASESLNEEREFQSLEVRSQWTYAPFADRTWTLSLEATDAEADLTYRRLGTFAPVIAAGFERPVDNTLIAEQRPRAMTYAASLAHSRKWQDVEAEVGLRVDAQEYRGESLRRQLSPRVNVRYDVSRTLRAYASWGRFNQAQRVYEWRTEAGQEAPDRAALATHAILGVTYDRPGSWRFTSEVYRKHWTIVGPYFDNLFTTLSLLPDLQPDRQLIAPAYSEASGVELSARRALSEAWVFSAAYTYSRVSDDFVGADDIPRSWDQPHAISATFSWQRGPWKAAILGAWHSGWPHTELLDSASRAPFVSPNPADRNGIRWDSYFTLDLNASFTQRLPGSDIELWLELTNGTDHDNTCCVHLAAAPSGGLLPEMEENSWMGRMLNIGVTWRLHGASRR